MVSYPPLWCISLHDKRAFLGPTELRFIRQFALQRPPTFPSPMANIFFETNNAIYFYGVREVRYGFLSNFHPCRFQDTNGNTYKSSEQYFMKRKQELFDPENEALALAMLKAKTPPEVKKLGRQVKNYDDEVWSACRLDAMIDGLKLKFSADEELKEKLLATGDKTLYEASRTDAIWGIGLGVAQVQKVFHDHRKFFEMGDVDDVVKEECYGQNLLGEALMQTRTWLREQEAQETP